MRIKKRISISMAFSIVAMLKSQSVAFAVRDGLAYQNETYP